MIINLLKDIEVKSSKIKDNDYFLNDGGGLRLKVTTTGKKIWQFRYTFNNKRKLTSFKTYPIVNLKEAREKRQDFQELLNKNIDPIDYYKNLKSENILDENGMFLNVAQEWLKKEEKKTAASTHINKLRTFEKDIYPYFKNKHISEITIPDVVKVLELKILQSYDVTSKIFSYLDSLFRYSVLNGLCERNILNDIKKGDIVPSRKSRHFPKITDVRIFKELVKAIYIYKGSHSIRNALRLVLHLPFRAENVCNMKWKYIDFDKKSITIPRNQMKIKDINLQDFCLPLSDEVINILREQEQFSGHQEWVFLGTSNRTPINSESPNKALKIMGFNDETTGRKITMHGFRGTCRSLLDTLDIENKFSFEAKEKLLDHHDNSKVIRAYTNKSDYFEHIKPIVYFWSEFVLKQLDNT
ncbi:MULTISPECIES: tyrosine-type recombinase/integrase [Aliarcobacter]|uniref:tyrosine-type recombinase/integrase n=1 Tax=Aliarcobacter TaxID=2321111 RepID=UPI0021B2A8B1|nr:MULTISPECIES: integrase arm-type DNA-binding domain-containing protein [Aliarcobacter]MCT7464195.1 tyrosine-type recombinase/integrase [Aliarcobacter cryaerophilus]MCT7573128.1 tyrosine-type recombinase/integrase [Aliarcobacter butzleri]